MLFRSQKPAQIRELIVHNLLTMSLNPETKEAQRLKALEMLGKLSDVQAFTERKETTVIHESSKIKAQLLDQLKTIVQGDNLVKDVSAESLLAELTGDGLSISQEDNPEPPPPSFDGFDGEIASHSIPHNQSSISDAILKNDEENQ